MLMNNDTLSYYMLWFSEFWLVHIGATPYWWDGINATLPSLAPCLDHFTDCCRSNRLLSRCLSHFTSRLHSKWSPITLYNYNYFYLEMVCWMVYYWNFHQVCIILTWTVSIIKVTKTVKLFLAQKHVSTSK